MSSKLHVVARYSLSLDASGGMTRLLLWADDGGALAEIAVLDDDRSVPLPRVSADLSHGSGFLHRSSPPALLDLLRNEPLVYVALEDEPVQSIRIHS